MSADIPCKQFGLNQAQQNVGADLSSYFLKPMLSLKEFALKEGYSEKYEQMTKNAKLSSKIKV